MILSSMNILTHFGHCVKIHTYWSYSSGEVYTYTYDVVGNRPSLTTHQGVVNYQYDAANCLLVSSSPGHSVSYTWDAANRLVGVSSPTSTVS